jgi:hypothetical protein
MLKLPQMWLSVVKSVVCQELPEYGQGIHRRNGFSTRNHSWLVRVDEKLGVNWVLRRQHGFIFAEDSLYQSKSIGTTQSIPLLSIGVSSAENFIFSKPYLLGGVKIFWPVGLGLTLIMLKCTCRSSKWYSSRNLDRKSLIKEPVWRDFQPPVFSSNNANLAFEPSSKIFSNFVRNSPSFNRICVDFARSTRYTVARDHDPELCGIAPDRDPALYAEMRGIKNKLYLDPAAKPRIITLR